MMSMNGLQGTGEKQGSRRRIGISGGTFDPVHYGHLVIAEEAREAFRLEKILFIPSGNPPHKAGRDVTPARHRYEMVRRAVRDNPYFEVSGIEINREGSSYTMDTLRELRGVYGENTDFYFIIGADIIPELTTWKYFEQVFGMCEFIAALRPGYNKDALIKEVEYLENNYRARIHIFGSLLIGVSSTMVRERVRKGRTIKYLVPGSVEEYIREKGLYRYRDNGDINGILANGLRK